MLRRHFIRGCLQLATIGAVIPDTMLRTFAIDATNGSPLKTMPNYNPLTPFPLKAVKISDEFWSPKIRIWREVTINDCLTKFEASGAVRNFDRVAAQETDGHIGDPWWDGLIYEMITGASDFLANDYDAGIDKKIDAIIDRIAAAALADADGYINTAVTLAKVAPKWSNPPMPGDMHNDRFPHTVYNGGCLVEAGVHHYRATGKTSLLAVSTRMANYMCRIMGPPPKVNIVPGHAISELAFVELYQLFLEDPELKQTVEDHAGKIDEHQYLELAEFWIENRGNHLGRESMDVYDQDDRPVFDQQTMEGHAVRSALLAAGVALAAGVNHRPEYYATASRWWNNMAAAKMYVTGGLGAIPTSEGFGPDYELPNTGYAETCASVAGGQFSANLTYATGHAHYFDVMERELYNGALSGVSVAGNSYFYTNFLESAPDRQRWDWNGCPCCPPMFLKMMGALPGNIYAADNHGVYVNLFVSSEATVKLTGQNVALSQSTRYPWDGHTKFNVSPHQPASFGLTLRVPEWCRQVDYTVNGHPIKPSIVRGYAHIERIWEPGDTVEMMLHMPVERVKANPRVVADVGRTALMRGPVVYCLEGLDNGGKVDALTLLPGEIKAVHRPDLLGGVTVLQGHARRYWSLRTPNTSVPADKAEDQAFTAIPFYANTNREPTHMAVWIAEDAEHAVPVTTEGDAIPTASHCYEGDTVWAINNGREPKASDDETMPRLTWWDHRGTSEWAQYTFPKVQEVCGVEVYWWDETRIKRDCRVPASWEIQYKVGEQWLPVTSASDYGTSIDTFNSVTFNPVHTDGLRLAVKLQEARSAGVLQWRVLV